MAPFLPYSSCFHIKKYALLTDYIAIATKFNANRHAEILKPGPGDYSIERAGSFGKGSILSSPSPLLRLRSPQLNPSADPDSMTLKLNKKVWAKFESEYSFPKKENARAVRGRVFNSTVQNFPQHHLGAFSPGAYLKT